jgi:hypothetical protein
MWQFSIDEATFEALLVSQHEPLPYNAELIEKKKKESVFVPGALLCTG